MAKKKTSKKASAPTLSKLHEARCIRELGRVKPDLAVFIWKLDDTALVRLVADDISKAIEMEYHYDLHKRSGLGADNGN